MPAPPPVITSRTNARVKELRASLSGTPKNAGDLLGLEGEHLIREAHLAGETFETVYWREGSEAAMGGAGRYADLRTRQWVVLAREVFDSAVSTASPQGIAATWRIHEIVPRAEHAGDVLVVENLQDPGNLGTLIRSVAAFNMERVLVTPETVNPWNPKVVRAAAGAIFHVPVERLPLEEIVERLRAEGKRLFAAVSGFPHGGEHDFGESTAPHRVLTGRRDLRTIVDPERFPLPKPPAGGRTHPAAFSYDVDFERPCAILVGNEGAGLSPRARALADEQVTIPCRVESLNAAVAGSVLLYEVMRQDPLRQWARAQGLRP